MAKKKEAPKKKAKAAVKPKSVVKKATPKGGAKASTSRPAPKAKGKPKAAPAKAVKGKAKPAPAKKVAKPAVKAKPVKKAPAKKAPVAKKSAPKGKPVVAKKAASPAKKVVMKKAAPAKKVAPPPAPKKGTPVKAKPTPTTPKAPAPKPAAAPAKPATKEAAPAPKVEAPKPVAVKAASPTAPAKGKASKPKEPIQAVMTGVDPLSGPSRLTKRATKERFVIEHYMRTSINALYDMISTPSGFSEWFCDDVNVRGDEFSFVWGTDVQQAVCIGRKQGELMRFHWEEDDDAGAFFELRIRVDPMTNDVALVVTDHAWPKDLPEARALWDSQVANLARVLGA
ncbi:MAG: hypothetical protein IT229_05605 [Flavobacteriales bacterium]|nr:hypothetical protein [Flavobacteriales bacterium]